MKDGVLLQTKDGKDVKVTLMDMNDDYLELECNPEEGVYGYYNENNIITMFLEKP